METQRARVMKTEEVAGFMRQLLDLHRDKKAVDIVDAEDEELAASEGEDLWYYHHQLNKYIKLLEGNSVDVRTVNFLDVWDFIEDMDMILTLEKKSQIQEMAEGKRSKDEFKIIQGELWELEDKFNSAKECYYREVEKLSKIIKTA